MHCHKHGGGHGGHGAHGGHGNHGSAGHLAAAATGIAATAAASSVTKKSGSGIMSKLTKNPLVVFGAGLVAGYFVHKYRKEIIETANRMGEKGKEAG